MGRAFGAVFGLAAMVLALVLFMLLSGFNGTIVAPPLFIVGVFVFFPLLFIVYGVFLVAICDKDTWKTAL